MKKSILLMAALFCMAGTASVHKLCAGIFPKNNLWIGPEHGGDGISEDVFNQVLDKITAVYNPIAASNGYQLQFNRLWSDGTVNSDTDTEGNTWVINSYGGLARAAGMTADGYTAVACHELGHHLGGAPQFSDGSGMSVEGEADYHVGTKCLRKVFAADDNVKIMTGVTVDPAVVTGCTSSFGSDAQQVALCERASMASFTIAQILQQLSGTAAIAFNTPDPSQVTQTFEDHPAAQCRLDTYFASSLCTVSPDVAFSNTDYKVGACLGAVGSRSRCWFSPN